MIFIKKTKNKTPLMLQTTDVECGIIALAIMLNYYKVLVPLNLLRRLSGVNRDGCKASTLIKIAQDFGFAAHAYTVDIADLYKQTVPVIAHWNFNHYIVVELIDHKRVYINDPAIGHRAIDLQEFNRSFTGVIIVIQPDKTPSLPNFHVSDCSNWLKLKIQDILYSCSIEMLTICFLLSNATLMSVFINAIIYNIRSFAIIIFVLTALSAIISLNVCQKLFLFHLTNNLILKKTKSFVANLFDIPHALFILRQPSEWLTFLDKIEYIINTTVNDNKNTLYNVLLLSLCSGLLAFLSWQSTCLMLIIYLTSLLLISPIKRAIYLQEQMSLTQAGRWYSFLFNTVKNIETIKASGVEFHTLARSKLLLSQKTTSNYLPIALNYIDKFKNISIPVSVLLMLKMSSLAKTILFYLTYQAFDNAWRQLQTSSKNSKLTKVSNNTIQGIDQLNESDPKQMSCVIPTSKPRSNNFLECTGLYFKYGRMSHNILEDINFSLCSGEYLAIVGDVGCGKSTLIKLLAGLCLPTQGLISIADQTVSKTDREVLSKLLSYVPQTSNLLPSNIRDNLTLFNANISDDHIREALRVVCLENIMRLPVFDEHLNFNLSGGQIQRIELARALLQETPLLLLDESTAAIDIHTENKIFNNMRKTNRTIICVTHRQSVVDFCDKLLVLEKGRVNYFGKRNGVNLDLLTT